MTIGWIPPNNDKPSTVTTVVTAISPYGFLGYPTTFWITSPKKYLRFFKKPFNFITTLNSWHFLYLVSHVRQQFHPCLLGWLLLYVLASGKWWNPSRLARRLTNPLPLTYSSPTEIRSLRRETNGFFGFDKGKKNKAPKKTGWGGSKSMCWWCFFQLKCVCLLMFKVLSSVSSSPKGSKLVPNTEWLGASHHDSQGDKDKGHNPSLTNRFLVSLVILSAFKIWHKYLRYGPPSQKRYLFMLEYRNSYKPSFLTITGRGATPKAFILRLDINYSPHSAKKKTYWCHLHPTFIGSFWKEHHPPFFHSTNYRWSTKSTKMANLKWESRSFLN